MTVRNDLARRITASHAATAAIPHTNTTIAQTADIPGHHARRLAHLGHLHGQVATAIATGNEQALIDALLGLSSGGLAWMDAIEQERAR